MKAKEQHILFLSSTDSLNYFPHNHACDFQVELSDSLHLRGNWTCALAQISFNEKIIEDLVILCDMCDESYIRDRRMPVLRVIPSQGPKQFIFESPFRLRVSRDELKRFRVYIRTLNFEIPSFVSGSVKCTLHLRCES